MASIRPAVSAADWDRVRTLLREYACELADTCCFAELDAELAELDRRYAAPEGRLLLAVDGEEVVGCGAFRRLEDGVVEGRRLYLRPARRGRGLGGALVLALLEESRLAGFRLFRLETLPGKMSAALALYRKLGFVDVEPWVAHPIVGAAYMELSLDARPR